MISKRISILSICSIVGLFMLPAIMLVHVYRTEDLISTVSQKEKVRLAYSYIQAAERSQRGFLLTGNSIYLEPFDTQESMYIISYPLTSTVQRKFDEMRETINLMKAGRKKEAVELVETDEGLKLMELITQEKEKDIDNLHKKEMELSNSTNRWKNGAITVACILSIGTSACLGYILYRLKQDKPV